VGQTIAFGGLSSPGASEFGGTPDDRRQNPIVCPTLEGACKKKKAPKTGASKWNLFFRPFFRARPSYFFFFGAAFFLGAAFLVALFID
jgi:hypothetical protein